MKIGRFGPSRSDDMRRARAAMASPNRGAYGLLLWPFVLACCGISGCGSDDTSTTDAQTAEHDTGATARDRGSAADAEADAVGGNDAWPTDALPPRDMGSQSDVELARDQGAIEDAAPQGPDLAAPDMHAPPDRSPPDVEPIDGAPDGAPPPADLGPDARVEDAAMPDVDVDASAPDLDVDAALPDMELDAEVVDQAVDAALACEAFPDPGGDIEPPIVQLRTLYISPDGDDTAAGDVPGAAWQTWTHALAQLAPGDTLIALPGTWTDDRACQPADPEPCIASTALPRVDCGGLMPTHQNGEFRAPITVRADTERGSLLRSRGIHAAFFVQDCENWRLEGLRGQSADLDEGGGVSVFFINRSEHIFVRRMLGSTNNRYGNTQIFQVVNGADILLEENEAYDFHRHGFSFTNGVRITTRRNYAHSRGRADLPGGRPSHENSQDEGDEGLTFYWSDDCTSENDIVEQSEGIQATGSRNHILGGIVIDGDFGFRLATNCNDAFGNCDLDLNYAQDNVARDLLSIRPEIAGIDCSSWNCQVSGATIVEPELWGFIGRDRVITPGFDGSFTVERVSVVGGEGCGFCQDGGEPLVSWEGDLLNSTAESPFGPEGGNDTGDWGRHYTVDPDLGGCYVRVPGDSPMRLSDDAAIGARITHRYIDRELSEEPLWDPDSGAFPCGAVVEGVNDIPGESCFDVHLRVGVSACALGDDAAADDVGRFVTTPPKTTGADDGIFEFHVPNSCDNECRVDGGAWIPCDPDRDARGIASFVVDGLASGPHIFEARNLTEGEAVVAEYRWTIDRRAPGLLEALAHNYHQVWLRASEPIDSASLRPWDIAICPADAAGFPCIDVSSARRLPLDRGRLIEMDLTRAQLPLEYTVVVPQLSDLYGNTGGPHRATYSPGGSRAAFVTPPTTLEDLDALPAPGGAGLIASADVYCQTLADAEGLQGRFRAWLSDGNDDAYCHITGREGVRGDCRPAEGTAGPWIRTDGWPLAPALDGLVSSSLSFALDRDAAGEQVAAEPGGVFTGSNNRGETVGDPCEGLTRLDAGGRIAAGELWSTDERWAVADRNLACDSSARLYCFQSEEGRLSDPFALPSIDHPQYQQTPSRLAFITSASYFPDQIQGTVGADVLCNQHASAAGLDGVFVAWFSSEDDDAYCRVSGRSGAVADGCGGQAPPPGAPWSRVDGVRVASDIDDLADGQLDAALSLDETGRRQLAHWAWTGSREDGTAATPGRPDANCNDWTDRTRQTAGTRSLVTRTAGWSRFAELHCEFAGHVYCFEQ